LRADTAGRRQGVDDRNWDLARMPVDSVGLLTGVVNAFATATDPARRRRDRTNIFLKMMQLFVVFTFYSTIVRCRYKKGKR
jgi:hypothetical protein